jgi:hypothetical protein
VDAAELQRIGGPGGRNGIVEQVFHRIKVGWLEGRVKPPSNTTVDPLASAA